MCPWVLDTPRIQNKASVIRAFKKVRSSVYYELPNTKILFGWCKRRSMEVITGKFYKMLLDERDRDAQRFWIIFSLLSIVNGGLLGFVINSRDVSLGLKLIASLLGIVLCIVWGLVQKRMSFWIRLWEKKLEEIEPLYFKELNEKSGCKTNGEEAKFPIDFKLFCNRRDSVYLQKKDHWTYWLETEEDRKYIYEFLREKGISTRRAGFLLPFIFGVAWIILAFFAIGTT